MESQHRPKGMLPWIGIAFALGVLAVLRAAFLPFGGALAAVAGWVLDVALVVVLGLTGRAAHRAGRRPSWQAALAGAAYGVVAGLGPLLFPPPAARILQAIRKSHPGLSAAKAHLALQVATSTGAHLVALVAAVLGAVLLGLLAGWVGSLTGRATEESRRAV